MINLAVSHHILKSLKNYVLGDDLADMELIMALVNEAEARGRKAGLEEAVKYHEAIVNAAHADCGACLTHAESAEFFRTLADAESAQKKEGV